MSIDELAQRAAQDLRDRVDLDPGAGLGDLVRTRSRRTAAAGAFTGMLAVVLALTVGLAVLRQPDPEPVDEGVRNGVLVGSLGRPGVISGGELPMPDDATPDSQLQFSQDGRELYYATTDQRVAAWDVRAERSRTLATCPRSGCLFSVSTDGATVALVGTSGFVWVDVATGDRRPYPFEPRGATSWSPDGRRIAVMAEDGLHVVDAVSGDSVVVDRAVDGDGFWGTAQWSPDGERLAYVLDRGRGRDIGGRMTRYEFSLVVLDVDGSDRRVLADLGKCVCISHDFPAAVTWSPDGTRLAASNPSRSSTFSYDLSGGDERRLGPGGNHLAWQPLVD